MKNLYRVDCPKLASDIREKLLPYFIDVTVEIETYYKAQGGYLCLKEIEKKEIYMIYKTNYFIDSYPIIDLKSFFQVFHKALEIEIFVQKVRYIHMVRGAKIYLDDVEKLGSFIEIEFYDNFNESLFQTLNLTLQLFKCEKMTQSYRELILSKSHSSL